MLKRILIFSIMLLSFIKNSFAISLSISDEYVKLNIIPEYNSISYDTQFISFISEIEIAKGWHLYWDNPGDTGDAVKLISLSPFLRELKSEKSKPSKAVFEDIITSYVFKDKMYIKSTYSLKNISNNDLSFNFLLNYTACKDECITKELPVNISINITNEEKYNNYYSETISATKDIFPKTLTPTASVNKNILNLKFDDDLSKCTKPEYASQYPRKNILSDLPITRKTNNNTLEITFYDELPVDFDGILFCEKDVYKISPILSQYFDYTLVYYIIISFIAGLILNLMPCVLPILGIKALYLIQNNKKNSFFSAISYLLGVLCSFVILAGILFYLRNKGAELGWGFQLQSPIFNIFLLLLFFVIFLNLIDKLPITDRFADKLDKLTRNKSFLTGFFAVIIACPCTGPFMGGALGYAITKPAIIYFGIFISLGIGYALPYTLIELFPRFFLKYIPKPGHWMITLKRFLSIPIALTCLWLSWIIYNQLTPSIPVKEELNWNSYNKELINEALRNKQSVFINFTAKWCLVCLLNDKTTLSTEQFKSFVKQNKIQLFKADWTTKDDAITDALRLYNRNSVPLYVYYNKGNSTPIILPQILTEGILESKIKDRLITQ